MSEPTEREWLEGLRPEDEQEFYDRPRQMNPAELLAAVRSAVSNETLYGWVEWRCFGVGPPCTAAEKFHLETWPCGFYLALLVDKEHCGVPREGWRGLTDTIRHPSVVSDGTEDRP